MHTPLVWVGFNIFILLLLVIDLVTFNKRPHEISIKEALLYSAGWITLALSFNVVVYRLYGYNLALQYFTGYLIEKSLSVDNLFVFLMLFSYFKVPLKYQHKVLYWGILGALVMRGILIILGSALVAKFHWVLMIFGGFLIVTGIKMAFQKEEKEIHPERNILVRIFKKIFPVTPGYHDEKFFVKVGKKRYATLLIVVLIVIETTDLLFAVDSIPAVFAVSTDSFIIYTSNVFAILGLRSLYFALAGMINMFYYLRHGLSIILTFIGVKMLIADFIPMPIGLALGVVGSVLVFSIAASLIRARRIQKS